MENREVIFASWLTGIHRLYEAGAESFVCACRELLQKYLDVETLLQILRKEESCKKQCELVEYAYQLSLCESEVKEAKTERKNLTSVFSRIVVREQETAKKMYYPLTEESVLNVFPRESFGEDGQGAQELKRLASGFLEEMQQLAKTPPDTWDNFIVVFDSLARKYMWCRTASDYEGEDISLYNQCRIAAAITACICRCNPDLEEWRSDNQKSWFQLAVCDFSGIQKYVFAVANVNERGVAKRLRARSFYVDITVSVIAQEILRRFALTQNHILMLTGGKFYLLLPNETDAEEKLRSIQKEIEHNFYTMFKGQVAVHLAWLPMGADGLEYYSKSITTLMRMLGSRKVKPFYIR